MPVLSKESYVPACEESSSSQLFDPSSAEPTPAVDWEEMANVESYEYRYLYR